MTDKQIQTEVVRLVNDVEYAALGFHATGGAERCIRAKEELHGYIAQLERIAGDLQTLCDKQALMLGERDAQLESVGADCESWYKQNQQSIDDANKFGGERDSA